MNHSASLQRALFSVVLGPLLAAPLYAQSKYEIRSMDVCGDSISRAFNGQGAPLCPNADQEQYNWATSNTNGTSFCASGPEGVFSQAERLECAQGRSVVTHTPNSAQSGAQMLKDVKAQADKAKAWLLTQEAPRYIPILMGHNDLCGGTVWKYNWSCSRGSDQNANNYCRTTGAAFERELRKALDVLITVPDTKIGVASMVRVSQLCNHGGKTNCQSFTNCQSVWSAVAYSGWIFGANNGICGSLTASCSDQRRIDAYNTSKMYRDITERVTEEYGAIPEGGASRVVSVGGQTVGGVLKAPRSTVVYSDAPWRYRFASSQLNCCDCFHPSPTGQTAAARILLDGLNCTAGEPCCRDTGNALTDAKCGSTETGVFYSGFFN